MGFDARREFFSIAGGRLGTVGGLCRRSLTILRCELYPATAVVVAVIVALIVH